MNSKTIIIATIIFPLLFIWQGLDFTDTGFYLTNYQQIFNDPKSIEYSFPLWLTNIIGGLWVKVFGDSLGLLGVNIAGVLVLYLTIVLTYLILRPYIDKKVLLIGLLFTMMFTKWVIPLYYNNLTSLFYVGSTFFFISGIKQNKLWQIIISGFTMGLNIFIRLPNILGFLIISGIFFYGYINKNAIKTQISQSLGFLFGYIFSIACILLSMKILDHFDIFIDSLKDFFGITATSGSRYGVFNLLVIYIKDYYKLTFLMFALTTLVFIFGWGVSRFSTLLKKNYVYILIIASILTAIFSSMFLRYVHVRVIFILLGILYVILTSYIINAEKSNKDFRLISFCAIIILFVTPIGSSNGIENAICGMWIATPVFFSYMFSLKKVDTKFIIESDSCLTKCNIKLNYGDTILFRNIIIFFFFIIALVWSVEYTYGDNPDRLKMRYSVNHPRLIGIFTTKERARVVQELLNEASKYVKEDDYVLSYNEIPLVHYLTKTRPYLNNSWVDLSPPTKIKDMIEKAGKEKPQLPVVIMAKFSTSEFLWPLKKVSPATNQRYLESLPVIDDFLNRNNYRVVWENDFFKILIPQNLNMSNKK